MICSLGREYTLPASAAPHEPLAALDLDAGETERAADLLTAIAEHPAAPEPERQRVEEMLSVVKRAEPPLIRLDDRSTWAVRAAVDDFARQLVSGLSLASHRYG